MNLQLTPLAKAEFEKWWRDLPTKRKYDFPSFEILHKFDFSMQYGVYLEYFDSVGIDVIATKGSGTIFVDSNIEYQRDAPNMERVDHQKAAIEKAFEIRENQLKEKSDGNK